MATKSTRGIKPVKTKAGLRYRVSWTDESRKYHRELLEKGTTKEEAEAYLQDQKLRVRQIKAGLEVREKNPHRLTVADITKRWLDAGSRDDRDRLTVERHILGMPLAKEPIDRVTPARINQHLDSLKPSQRVKVKEEKRKTELSAATKNHVRKHLSSIFKHAISRGWLVAGKNPVAGTEAQRVKKKALVTLSLQECVALVKAAKHPWDSIIAVALHGLRRGEIWGLNIEDIDLKRGEIRVRRSHDRTTKSGRERVVPIHPGLSPFIGLAVANSHSQVLFPGEKAERRSERSRGDKEFRAALKAAGITRHVRFHDLRHTAATLMLQAGATLVHVKDVLGHATVAITADTYGHLVMADLRSALERVPLPLPAPEGLQ